MDISFTDPNVIAQESSTNNMTSEGQEVVKSGVAVKVKPSNVYYKSKWENDPLLKPWIARHPLNEGKVVCEFCRSIVRAHRSDLIAHSRTLKHQRNFKKDSSTEEFNKLCLKLSLSEETSTATNSINESLTAAASDVNSPVGIPEESEEESEYSLTTVNRNTILDLSGISNSNTNLYLRGNNDCDLIAYDIWWPGGNEVMDAGFPSDLLRETLDETQPSTSTSTNVLPGIFQNINICLTPTSRQGINNKRSLGFPGSKTEATNPTDNHNDLFIQNEMFNGIFQPSVAATKNYFTCKDVEKAIVDGRFTINELYTIAKTATTEIQHSVSSHTHLLVDDSSGAQIQHSKPTNPKIGSRTTSRKRKADQ